jgi:hypothetical protein
MKENIDLQVPLLQIADLLRESAGILQSILNALDSPNRLIFSTLTAVSEHFEGDFVDRKVVHDLEDSETFQKLLRTVMSNEILWEVLIGIDKNECIQNSFFADIEKLFTTYAAKVLLRAILAINLRRLSDGIDSAVGDFLSFLSPGPFERKVIVPIHHLRLSEEGLDFGSFGQLHGHGMTLPIDDSLKIAVGLEDPFHCSLSFTIEAKKFLGATQFPISDGVQQRIAILRLGTSPFVSHNHFSVSHRSPWESPLQDSEFHTRFWGKSTNRKAHGSSCAMRGEHVEMLTKLIALSKNVPWERSTPWRLAIDRLDDAMFKLECGSPDAILDIMIGIESLFVEQSSRQESTHKVATRVARFLSNEHEKRHEVFKAVKRLYGVRSKLAHGQPWKLDERGMKEVGVGADLLCRSLKKMLEEGVTSISHIELDLF